MGFATEGGGRREKVAEPETKELLRCVLQLNVNIFLKSLVEVVSLRGAARSGNDILTSLADFLHSGIPESGAHGRTIQLHPISSVFSK